MLWALLMGALLRAERKLGLVATFLIELQDLPSVSLNTSVWLPSLRLCYYRQWCLLQWTRKIQRWAWFALFVCSSTPAGLSEIILISVTCYRHKRTVVLTPVRNKNITSASGSHFFSPMHSVFLQCLVVKCIIKFSCSAVGIFICKTTTMLVMKL